MKKYNRKALREGVQAYFSSISRTVPVTEQVPTGERDEYGHPVYAERAVRNDSGEEITVVQYLVPPTLGDLAKFLGVSADTVTNYGKDPNLRASIQYARDEILRWNMQELLTREGKNTKGIEFNLKHNFGIGDRVKVELGEETRNALKPISLEERAELLREIAERYG